MAESNKFHSGRASLCALGEYLRRLQFFAPLREQVKIPQKTVKYRPVDKLLDALVSMLCGAKTIAQSHVTVRGDPAVQRAFGRRAIHHCADIARLYGGDGDPPINNHSNVAKILQGPERQAGARLFKRMNC